jgi:hypothetical protein
MIDINTSLKDDISEKMLGYSEDENRKTVNLSLKQSQSRIQASEAEKEQIIRYPETISCRN